jgi:ABC-type sugar transport system ATPase subunit
VSVTADAQPVLDVRHISKRYGGIQAVADGSLTVGRGEMVGLVGPNGCGKSTMLNMVSGLVKPDGGELLFHGEPLPVGKYQKTQAMGVLLVPQELALAPRDTVWENIVLGSEPSSAGFVSRRRARKLAAEALALLGHEFPLNAEVNTLSPVQRRLITIARGAVHPHTRLLILDEPTAGLPHEEAARVIDAMNNLVASDRSLILVSHHIDDIVAACRKVTLMRDGRTYRTLTDDEVNKDLIVSLLLGGAANMPSAETVDRRTDGLGEEVANVNDVSGEFLDGVSMTVNRGEVVGLAGILGSGATEMVQMLTGQRQPRIGQIKIGKRAVTPSNPHKALRSGVGFVSGDRANLVIKTMTVSEHVALPALERLTSARLMSRRQERKWVTKSLDALSVKGTGNVPMTSLSGGNQQRALMSRWVGLPVDVLVIDQPTVGVDLAGRAQLLGVIRQMADERGIVLAAEPDELAASCDRVICMRRGRIAVELRGGDITEDKILGAIA